MVDQSLFAFESLRLQYPAPQHCTTLAYWIGTLTDDQSKLGQDADEACTAMSHQFDVEEQGNLCGFPQYVPDVFMPVAPVTLAKQWSPFPLALQLLGRPTQQGRAKYGKILFVFNPVETISPLKASSEDEAHFLFLLTETNRRANTAKSSILLCGSPGWSYSERDFIAGDKKLQKQMKQFGFIYQARKPSGQ